MRHKPWNGRQGLSRAIHRLARGNRAQKVSRVGVARLADDLPLCSHLHEMACIQDCDSIGHLGHDTQIVRDQNHGHFSLLLDRFQETQDLRLNRYIQSRGGLVRNQELWLTCQSHGNHHPLRHTTRELMRVRAKAARGVRDSHLREKLDHLLAPRLAAVLNKNFVDLLLNRVTRVEARHRVLKDHGDSAAANLLPLAARDLIEAKVAEYHSPRSHRRDLGQKAHQSEGRHALSGTRLSHQPQCFAGRQVEIETVEHANPARPRCKLNSESFDSQKICLGVWPDWV
jgi:hypothetical protein